MTLAAARLKMADGAASHPHAGRGETWWIPVIVFWGLATALYVYVGSKAVASRIPDTDIAMRLVQLRGLLEGQGWYDLSIPRLAPGEGYVSHWSRLVDAGLAALYHVYAVFLPSDQAEFMMRLTWPLLMILLAIAAVTLIARRISGHADIAFLAAGLAALNVPLRFFVGDIDHHGIVIALMMAAWAALFHAHRSRLSAFASGWLFAMAMAVSLEVLPLLLPLALVSAALFVWQGPRARAMLEMQLAGLAVGSLLFLALTVPPSMWLSQTACDAFAPNWGLPLATAALLGLALVRLPFADRGRLWRAGLLALPVAVAGALFVAFDPACLKGPFAHMDPRLRPVWLNHVKEVSPIWGAGVDVSLRALWVWSALAFAGAAALMGWRWRRHHEARPAMPFADAGGAGRPLDDAFRRAAMAGLMLATLLALVLSAKAVRYIAFAQWLALPLAVLVLGYGLKRLGRRARLVRVPAMILASPLVMLLISAIIWPSESAAAKAENQAMTCTGDAALGALNRAPAGLVASAIDMGPYVLARSHHSVLAAPYHRLGESMLAISRIFAVPPEKARGEIARWKVDYVLFCKDLVPPLTLDGGKPPADALWFQLAKGKVPAWLEPMDLGKDNPLRLYRVRLDKAEKADSRKDKRRAEAAPLLRRSIH